MRTNTRLGALYVHQFRPFEDAEYSFGPSLNLICGPNARGKTSLLEAIYFLMTGSSFRTSRLPDMMRAGSGYFHLEGAYSRFGISHQLKVTCTDKERRVVNNTTLSHNLSALPGILPGVVMTPEDIAIIKGAPQVRRDFLDLQISQVDPLYIHFLSRYQRAMRQRNALLRVRQTASIEIWEHEMAQAAAYIIHSRCEAVEGLRSLCQEHYNLFGTSAEKLDLQYQTLDCNLGSQEEISKHLLHQYGRLRGRELELGNTLTGPHRDDLEITLNGSEARYFASEGQQRTCVAALRCAEWQRIHLQIGEKPLMLIDDAGMGLDQDRQGRLVGHLSSLGQVFVTTTSEAFAEGVADRHCIRL